jgi:glutaredoxin
VKVTLFTQEGCGLCLEAERSLRGLMRETEFNLELVDIAADREMFKRYWDRIPVVAVDGEEVAAAPFDDAVLRTALKI